MDIPAEWRVFVELLKPGSVIMGTVIVIQLFHKLVDAHRGYKIKQIEVLVSCISLPDSSEKAYAIEKILEKIYGSIIPYAQAKVMIEHPKRHQLFAWYHASIPYLSFADGSFYLDPKYNHRWKEYAERFRFILMQNVKYYSAATIGLTSLYSCYYLAIVKGLFSIDFLTYNFAWAGLLFIAGAMLIKLAFQALANPKSLSRAIRFEKLFRDSRER